MAAVLALDTPHSEPILRTATHSLFMRVLDKPAMNDHEPSSGVRIFDRFQLVTHRLAFFRMQTRPVAANGAVLQS